MWDELLGYDDGISSQMSVCDKRLSQFISATFGVQGTHARRWGKFCRTRDIVSEVQKSVKSNGEDLLLAKITFGSHANVISYVLSE